MIDLVIPPWARIAALAVCVGLIFGAGVKSGAMYAHSVDAQKVADAKDSQRKAESELADYKRQVLEASAESAIAAAKTTIHQSKISQESAHAYINSRSSLDQRIASGGLRLGKNPGDSRSCNLGPASVAPARVADGAEKPVPTDASGSPGEVHGPVVESVRQEVIENAARDALQLASLIDSACKLGLCAGQK